MTEHDSILPKFKEYQCIVRGVEAKHQSINRQYKQNLSMKFFPPFLHNSIRRFWSHGQITYNKIIFKTGLTMTRSQLMSIHTLFILPHVI